MNEEIIQFIKTGDADNFSKLNATLQEVVSAMDSFIAIPRNTTELMQIAITVVAAAHVHFIRKHATWVKGDVIGDGEPTIYNMSYPQGKKLWRSLQQVYFAYTASILHLEELIRDGKYDLYKGFDSEPYLTLTLPSNVLYWLKVSNVRQTILDRLVDVCAVDDQADGNYILTIANTELMKV